MIDKPIHDCDKSLRLSFREILGMLRHAFDKQPPFSAFYEWMPTAEILSEVEKDWFHLKWEPLRGIGWNWYLGHDSRRNRPLLWVFEAGAHNGWGRSYEKTHIEIALPFRRSFCFWIRWRIHVIKNGPSDWHHPLPLDENKIEAIRKISSEGVLDP